MTTYKEDDSFFTTVFPPFVHHGFFIKNWLLKNESSKFRYIRDFEVENEFLNVEQVREIYPGVKTIGMVLNPWNRMSYGYEQLCLLRTKAYNNYNINFELLNLNSFEDFIKSLPTTPAIDPFWFTLATPQTNWLNRGELNADYVLRAEFLNDDVQVLRDYFCSNLPLENYTVPELTSLELPSYKEYYNEETKAIVAEVFKEDIEKYGYEF